MQYYIKNHLLSKHEKGLAKEPDACEASNKLWRKFENEKLLKKI